MKDIVTLLAKLIVIAFIIGFTAEGVKDLVKWLRSR